MSSKCSLDEDAKFGSFNQVIHQTESRLVRASIKNFETTGTYLFLELFKSKGEFGFNRAQQICLTRAEWDLLTEKWESDGTKSVKETTPQYHNPWDPITPEMDSHLGNRFIDISTDANRWIRLTITNYPYAGTYYYIKLFEKNPGGTFYRAQQLAVTTIEWDCLMSFRFLIHIELHQHAEAHARTAATQDSAKGYMPIPVTEALKTDTPATQKPMADCEPATTTITTTTATSMAKGKRTIRRPIAPVKKRKQDAAAATPGLLFTGSVPAFNLFDDEESIHFPLFSYEQSQTL